MPVISEKGRNMPESPIRKLVPYAEAAKELGKKVLHLNIGQPDIETPEVALTAINNFNRKVVEYSHSAGFESYRKGLAKYYQGVGLNVKPENVMITTGGSEALLFGFGACLNEGDEVIIPEPFYANYNGFAVAAGVKVVPVSSSIENGFALPPISEFEELITSRTKAILICNPGNPTGYLYSESELELLKNLVLKHDLFLFADEVYREFVYEGKNHKSVLEFEELSENAILIDSVSKRYSMCGARIGALVTRNKEVYNTVLKFAQARLSPPTFGQVAGEAALNTPASYFNEVNEEYVKRRDLLVDGLNNIPGVICPKPSGAFYAMASLPVKDTEEFCKWLLNSFDYKGYTVMMAPANGFYATPGKGKKEVRLAYVLNLNDLKIAVDCLHEALKRYPESELFESASEEVSTYTPGENDF